MTNNNEIDERQFPTRSDLLKRLVDASRQQPVIKMSQEELEAWLAEKDD